MIEDAADQSTVDFRALFETSPSPLLVLSPRFQIIAVNNAYLSVTSTRREQIVGHGLFEVFPENPGDPEASGPRNLRASLERVLAYRRPDAMAVQKYDIRRPDGGTEAFEERYWTPLNTPVLGPDGEVSCIIHRVDDVTAYTRLFEQGAAAERLAAHQTAVIDELREANVALAHEVNQRKLAQEALRESEAKLRELNGDLERKVLERSLVRGRTWQISPDLLSVMNPDGGFESTNPAWQATLGWSEAELARTPYIDFVHPEDVFRTTAAFEDLKRGRPVLRFENRYRGRDGQYRWLSWVAVPEGAKFYCSARDISPEKAQAAELAERTAERDRVWRNSRDLLVIVGADGVFRDVNPAWATILGHDPSKVVGRSFLEFVWPDDAARTQGRLDAAATQGDLTNFENRYRHEDGTPRWISWRTSVEEDFVYASGRDTTAEKDQAQALHLAEEALRQSQKMEALGQLTGGVAHDFNNLLTIIRSSADFLRRRDLPDERRKRYVDAIAETVERASKLTGQLLAFARRQPLKPEVFDVGDRVESVAALVRPLVGSRVRIDVDLRCPPCFAEADAGQFEAALVNLAVNARDAMDGEGVLVIKVEAVSTMPSARGRSQDGGEFIAVSVQDTGSGIAPDALEHVFEPFYTTKDVGKGTGLGLSQVFGFAKQSGGEIEVASEPGRGAVFTLYLPKVEGAPASEPPKPRGHEPRGVGRGARVLVVEDNDAVGQFSTELLQDLGYGTIWAANATEALELLAKEDLSFDLVFSDVVMPGMNGVELAQRVRDRYPGLPIVLTSGYASVLAEQGHHGFELVQKPYSVESLSRVLRRAISDRPSAPPPGA